MVDTVNFFFLGTSHHRSSYQDVLTSFYQKTQRTNINTRLFDGVGSDPGADDKNPAPGQYIYEPENDLKKRIKGKPLENLNNLIHRLAGCLAGEGMDALLFEALLFLENLKQKKQEFPKRINLCGFSRGADACMRLANLLNSMYPEIEVNMFLIDHVPGPGRRDDPSSYTIPRNVKKFESAIMLHEFRPGFDPQDINRYVIANPRETVVTVKAFPGWHSRGVYLSSDPPKNKTNHVPRLIHDDLFRFAKETEILPQEDALIPEYVVKDNRGKSAHILEKAHVLSPEDRFKEYVGMLENWRFYKTRTAYNLRDVLTHPEQYTPDKNLFVNQEHSGLFSKLYPALSDWFLNNNKREIPLQNVKSELDKLSVDSPYFHTIFSKIYKIEKGEIPKPSKLLTPYFCSKLGNTLVNDDLSFLQHSIVSLINYTFHHLKENSMETRVARRVLLSGLERANTLDSPEKATEMLHETICNTCDYLSYRDSKTYMAQQLKKIGINPRRFVDKMVSTIEPYLNNSGLSETQKTQLINVRTALGEVLDNPKLTSLQKIKEVKLKISTLSNMLGKSDSEHPKTSAYPFFSSSIQEAKPSSDIKNLICSLNRLADPNFGEISLSKTLARRFKAYVKRKAFLEGVNRILSAISPFRPHYFVSPEKIKLSKRMVIKLEKLDETGLGNNLTEIESIFTEGVKELNEIYLNNRKLYKGELDKVMEKSHRDIGQQIKINITPPKEEAFKDEVIADTSIQNFMYP